MKNQINTEIKLLKSLCGKYVEDVSLHKDNTDAQLVVIGGFCHQLGMSISDMVSIGREHSLDESKNLLKNLTMYYLVSFEDIIRKMCEDTIMTEDKIDSMIDGITLSYDEYDDFYTLAMDECKIDLGDNALSWLPSNNLQEPTNGNLNRNFSLYEMIDRGTEIDYTDNCEFGYINGIRYDLANLSRDKENSLLLSMLRTATQKLLTESKEG